MIIPQREPLGSYNKILEILLGSKIIPQREPLGSYNFKQVTIPAAGIIPQREPLGSYNKKSLLVSLRNNYTTTRTTRELQPICAGELLLIRLYHNEKQ